MFGFVMWDFLPVNLNEIKQVEVLRGPASAVWGANALNGVVNVTATGDLPLVAVFAGNGGAITSASSGNDVTIRTTGSITVAPGATGLSPDPNNVQPPPKAIVTGGSISLTAGGIVGDY